MRRYELRVYSLATREDLDFFKDVIYPRHMDGFFPKVGIRAHGFWTVDDDPEHRLLVLTSLDQDADPTKISEGFLSDPDFLADLRGFGPSGLLGVEISSLTPTASSPLQ